MLSSHCLLLLHIILYIICVRDFFISRFSRKEKLWWIRERGLGTQKGSWTMLNLLSSFPILFYFIFTVLLYFIALLCQFVYLFVYLSNFIYLLSTQFVITIFTHLLSLFWFYHFLNVHQVCNDKIVHMELVDLIRYSWTILNRLATQNKIDL